LLFLSICGNLAGAAAPAVAGHDNDKQENTVTFEEFAETNRIAWNEAALRHEQARDGQLEQAFAQPGYILFDEWEKRVFERLPVRGKRVAQLPCNNGRELVSLVNFGAQYGVGFDIADENIRWAKRLKSCANANCDFYRCDILSIGREFDAQFDFVYISEGSLVWFENLRDYFGVAARLLVPGGWILIHEAHPITQVFEYTFAQEYPVELKESYFIQGPLRYDESSGLDYVGKTEYEGQPTYEFPHTMADIINGLVQSSFEIMELHESGQDIVEGFAYLEKLGKLPLSFALTARKK
jgi:SAM-dependent methyltransferase